MGKEAKIEELKRQNAIMRAALEKYADRESWGGASGTKEGETPVLSHWVAEMYAGIGLAGGFAIAKAALEEVDAPAKYDTLMAKGMYWEAAEVGVKYCDVCGRSEVSNIINGTGQELIKMTRHAEWCGLVVCEDCPGPEEGDE